MPTPPPRARLAFPSPIRGWASAGTDGPRARGGGVARAAEANEPADEGEGKSEGEHCHDDGKDDDDATCAASGGGGSIEAGGRPAGTEDERSWNPDRGDEKGEEVEVIDLCAIADDSPPDAKATKKQRKRKRGTEFAPQRKCKKRKRIPRDLYVAC